MRKYTQKQLRELIQDGRAQDITRYSFEAVAALHRSGITQIGYSRGVYGCNGAFYSRTTTRAHCTPLQPAIAPLHSLPDKHVAPCINSQLGRKRPGSAGGLDYVGFQTCTTERNADIDILHNKGGRTMTDYITSAAALYDGGWRAEDKEQLIQEYGLTEEEANRLTERLADLEEINGGIENG